VNEKRQRTEVANPLNQCSICEQDFASLAAFDEHVLSAPSDAVFACLSVEELRVHGWTQNDRGRWTSPKSREKAERARAVFDGRGPTSMRGRHRRPAGAKVESDSPGAESAVA
jgi:hypothetical protein